MSYEWTRHSERNRRAWNEVADIRAVSYEGARDASFFRQGRVTLDEEVQRAVGEVRGLRLLHLMCSTGEETLSWAVLGADAVSVDISERQVELAREKAEAAKLPPKQRAAVVLHYYEGYRTREIAEIIGRPDAMVLLAQGPWHPAPPREDPHHGYTPPASSIRWRPGRVATFRRRPVSTLPVVTDA